jgi:hypothetical protein
MIPDKVKIGYKEYEIIKVDYPILVNGKECYGSIDYNTYVIKINGTFKDNHQEATFWHEVLHGIDEMHNGNKLEEPDIELLSKGLFMFFKDNPDLFK